MSLNPLRLSLFDGIIDSLKPDRTPGNVVADQDRDTERERVDACLRKTPYNVQGEIDHAGRHSAGIDGDL
jgi:hypothetical protein